MNKVYEDFISEIIDDLVNMDPDFDEFIIERQEKFNSLFREEDISIRPDVVLRRKNTDEYPLIIDAKYKKSHGSEDVNKIGYYGAVLETSEAGCLIYPYHEAEATETVYHAKTGILYEGRPDIRVHVKKVNLFFDDEICSFDEYMHKIKNEVKEKILSCL